jgi:hypothetical protein
VLIVLIATSIARWSPSHLAAHSPTWDAGVHPGACHSLTFARVAIPPACPRVACTTRVAQWYFETFCSVEDSALARRGFKQLDGTSDIVPHLDGVIKPYDRALACSRRPLGAPASLAVPPFVSDEWEAGAEAGRGEGAQLPGTSR